MAVLLLCFHAFVVLSGVKEIYGENGDTLGCSSLGNMMDCSRMGLVELPESFPSWVTRIDLQSNGISSIQQEAFSGLLKLEQLDLSNNELTSINKTVFQNLPALKNVKLGYNKLTEIPRLGKNSSVTHLYLHHNHIRAISSSILADLPKLRLLDLNYNRIVDIQWHFPCWPQFCIICEFLNNNRIMSMEGEQNFGQSAATGMAQLNKNNLSSLPKEIFKELKKLKYLELTRNKFRVVEGLMFNGLDSLQVLKLRRNKISILRDGAFWGLNSIQNLHLDHNNISRVEKGWLYGLKTVEHLSLTHNNIQSIEAGGWECPKLQELDLMYNKLTTINEWTFQGLPQLKFIYLDHNNISHIDDGAFSGLRKLHNLEMNHNEISWTVEDMNGAFLGLESLGKLGLNSNRIRSIAREAFVGLEGLKQLQLTDNSITSIQENAFQAMVDLRELHLNSSNLLCDCKLSWLPVWLKRAGFESSVNGICAHPEWLKGKSIFTIDQDDFKCKDFPKPIIIQQPKSEKALKGANVTLQCAAASSGTYPTKCQWRKDNVIMTNADIENFASQEDDITNYVSKLHLRNIQDDAAGKYQCIISNNFGPAYSKKADITVHVYPWFTKTPIDVTVKAGSTAKLECAAKGQPPPQIAFQKDGGDDFPAARERRMHVMPTDEVFFIVSVKSSDEGVYSCTATNDAGTIIANASLTVLETPSFVRPMEDKKTQEGETTVMECLSSGSPKPRLNWQKDGRPLEMTQRHFFTAHNQLLIIVQTQPSDSGKYTCIMSNTLGTKKDESNLVVITAAGTASRVSIDGGLGGLDDESTTTGIIIIAVVCCVVGTSLVWVIIIYQTRKRHEEYSTTPTDETTLPGEVPSSSCNTSEKEASYLTGAFSVTGYHYHDYQLKEASYDPGGGRGFPGATFGCSSAKGRHAAIFPRDADQQCVPLTLGEHQPAQNSGGNSVSSLQYPNSDTDSLKSSHSTDSTRMSGQDTLQPFHPISTNHDRLENSSHGEEPETVVIVHQYPSPSSLSSGHPPNPTTTCSSPNSTAHDRHHGAQPPGNAQEHTFPSEEVPSVYSNGDVRGTYSHTAPSVVQSHSNPALRLTSCPKDSVSGDCPVITRPLSYVGMISYPVSPVNTHYDPQSLGSSSQTCSCSHKLKLRGPPEESTPCDCINRRVANLQHPLSSIIPNSASDTTASHSPQIHDSSNVHHPPYVVDRPTVAV
ncbi:LOW QUALITY PROTEIN: leucine-rich repeats and immunoglobulin-like domains protein 2 [Liolophura sinensis]|uniref:LOW QUALITY PROTEIN: leucine-rich repeats and immunoglobulin-like domains protein 2 n=1 Tax=Liolophura sinensis TaxID=3198878 RepID=UPI00315927C9